MRRERRSDFLRSSYLNVRLGRQKTLAMFIKLRRGELAQR